MAIGKLTKGSNASGLVDYLLAEVDHKGNTRPCARIVGGTMGLSAHRTKSTFQTFADLRPGLGRNVVHMSISLPEGDRQLADCNVSLRGRPSGGCCLRGSIECPYGRTRRHPPH